jgi:hypothetical protein
MTGSLILSVHFKQRGGHMEYERTVLIIGSQQRFNHYICRLLNNPKYRIPACARTIGVNGVRYVHIGRAREIHGYRADETSYKYIGPWFSQVETILLECHTYGYTQEPFPDVQVIKKEEK